MDVRFDSAAAEQLLRQMDVYCTGVVKETRSLLEITKTSTDWNDNQAKAFSANMRGIAEDLNKALALESEYMKSFYQRIQELKGVSI